MIISEAAMWIAAVKPRDAKRPSKRSSAMRNALEFSDMLLEANEAATFLKVSLSWLAKARATNEGPPFIRIGRCIRYSKAALLR
jgi:hypothetical protein